MTTHGSHKILSVLAVSPGPGHLVIYGIRIPASEQVILRRLTLCGPPAITYCCFNIRGIGENETVNYKSNGLTTYLSEIIEILFTSSRTEGRLESTQRVLKHRGS